MTNGRTSGEVDLWINASQDALQRLTDLARRVLKARSAILSSFTGDRQVVLCHAGMPEMASPTTFDTTPCHITLASETPIVAPVLRDHPLLRAIAVPGVEAYLGVPIRLSGGLVVGTFCVTDAVQHDWSEDDLDLVLALAGCLAGQIELGLEQGRRERAEAALRESQAHFTAVADNIPGLMFERRKTEASRAEYTFFGSRKADHAFAQSMAEDGLSSAFGFIHADDRERVRAALLRSTVEESDLDLTFRAVRDDGSVAWLRTQAVVRRGAPDNTVSWDGLCVDISDLAATGESAGSARGAVEAALVDVGEQLRAPILAIIGYGDLLETEARPDFIVAHAKNIRVASRSLLAMLDQWLDMAGAKATSDPTAPTIAPPSASDEPVVTAPAVETAITARILLADDLDLNRKLISDMLMIEGYDVDCVADGAAAVKAASESPYDLILMDMIMPGMDGIAATRAIRALPAPTCDVPIVALTANSFREQLDSCLSAGMNGTLTKPMSMDALTQAVFAWTHGRTEAA